ncbi:MAG TPA: hypothetical protein VGF01_12775 [Terracidiphilus sp.]|jgi:hypothetical protein
MLVHVIAREMLQKANRRAAEEKTVPKIDAEAMAFIVAQTIGLSTGRAERENDPSSFRFFRMSVDPSRFNRLLFVGVNELPIAGSDIVELKP